MDPTRASIVILAWNGWVRTRDCLDSLRPTLSPHDEVIVVDNGSTDFTPRGLAQYPWVRVLTNDENRGFAAGCNQGAAAARGDVLVFLNNDTVVTRRWLEPLLDALAEPGVAAAGPRSNFVSGAQLVPDPGYEPTDVRAMKAFARSWCERHRGRRSDTNRLVGFCLAVRRDAFEAVGGFDEGYGLGGFEDDDLCARLRDAGHRLRIVHDSFVHHVGHATFEANGVDWFALQQENQKRFVAARRAATGRPLISACMIVKDEEAMLPGCLESLRGLVDEVVVYDTGSTDRTVEIARAAGAKVIEGYWDDDFGRARNAALAECAGDWILHVDADERVEGDVEALRTTLLRGVGQGLVFVEIANLDRDGSEGVRHRAVRLFRRGVAHWRGRLHEQVVPLPGVPKPAAGRTGHIRIRHLGYTAEMMEAKGKVDRNLRLAVQAVEEAGDDALAHHNLGRSLVSAGRFEEALAAFERARGLVEHRTAAHVALLHDGVEALFRLGRPAEAIEWIAELRALGVADDLADFLEGTARLLLGQEASHLLTLDDGDEVWSAAGISVASSLVRQRRALALAAAERWAEAADLFAAAVADQPELPLWAPFARSHVGAGRDPRVVAELVPDEHLRSVLVQLLTTDPEAADAVGEALWERLPGDPRLLGFAVHHGPRVPAARALEWSARVRTAGLAEHCPLVARARAADVEALDRLRAAAIAHGAFGDERAARAVDAVAPLVGDRDLATALLELDALAPDLLGPFTAAVAAIPSRRAGLAAALDAVGAAEQAAIVREISPEPFMSAR